MELLRRALRYRLDAVVLVAGVALVGAHLFGLRAGELLDLIMGAAGALVLGLLAALTVEAVLRPVTTAEDVREACGQAPLVVPGVSGEQHPAEALAPAVAELVDTAGGRCHVGGLRPGSGKSTLAAALALAAAGRFGSARLLDADFQRTAETLWAQLLPPGGGGVELQRVRLRDELEVALAGPVPEGVFEVCDHGPAEPEELAALAASGRVVLVVAPRSARREDLRAVRSAFAAAGAGFTVILNLGGGPAPTGNYYRRPA